MRRTLLGLGAALAALAVSTHVAAVEPAPASRPHSASLRVPAGAPVEIGASVPTRARAVVAGRRVTARHPRPAVLQRRVDGAWTTLDRTTSRRTGAVRFRLVAPAATTTYRVLAPRHRVRVARQVDGRTLTKRVTLRAWTGQPRTVAVDPAQPSQQPNQQPTQQPTQQPSQEPSQQPSQEPQRPRPSVALLDSVPAGLAGSISEPDTDASGRYLAFLSGASDLVPGDDNGQADVFVLDTATGELELISRAPDGTPANRGSAYPEISADGRHVAFASEATDLVAGSTGPYQQVYVHDLETGRTELVSKAPDGTPGDGSSSNPSLSRDGRFVAFDSWAVNVYDVLQHVPQTRNVLRHDRATGLNDLLTFPRGDWVGQSWWPSMSDDGTRVTYLSQNESLVPDDGNGEIDVFLNDLSTGVRKMVSRRADGGVLRTGSNRPLISGDGGAVTWSTPATGVVPGDDNESDDAFRYDVGKRRNTLLSREPSGRPLDAISSVEALDGSGTTVVVSSTWQRTGFVRALYLADASTGDLSPLWTTTDSRPVPGRGVAVSADGSRILFVTGAALVPGDDDQSEDLYVWERD